MSYNKTKYIDTDFAYLIELFEDKDNLHIPKSSKERRIVICPCCKHKYSRTISDVVKAGHVTCPTCLDGFSYPEKFMANVLRALDIDFDYQFQPNWLGSYRYDFKIYQNIIIEMDGSRGHGHRGIEGNDKEKDSLAIKNGYKVYRVDCSYDNKNKYTYIKQSIINTLSGVIDLSNVDWDLCNEKSLISKIKETIDCYKNDTIFINEIAQRIDIKPRTVVKYLKDAMKEGIIDYQKLCYDNPFIMVPSDIKINININTLNSSRKVFVYNIAEKELFCSVSDVCKKYGYKRSSFVSAVQRRCLFDNKKFVLIDDLKNFDFNQDFRFNKPRGEFDIYQYNDNYKLINIYHSKHDIPSEYYYGNIWRACQNKRYSAYGYYWSYVPLNKESKIS